MMATYTKQRSDGCTVTGNMVDDKIDGTVTVTYPNEITKSLEHYEMNVPVGMHEFWGDDGSLQHTIKYNNLGEVIEIDGTPVPPVLGGE